ncbi:uncharacterized protein LOC111714316, partial [Eurytemora carolleeae]|uniref:uncharacterized protein LOC111714316 n=1 Tax=Eurytemora carolleeae TaxID=1294199 RepID=UPI000C77AA3B
MLLLYASVLLVSVHTVHSSSCTAFSVSECTGDGNAIYLELNTSRDKCQQYCAIEDQCKFYRYSDKPVQGVNCLLYQEPFRTYVGHCNVRSGPKEKAPNCLEPTEDSCDVVQGGKCIYTGVTVESFDSLQMEECMALCAINPNCKLWIHEKESTECQLLDSSEIICLETFGPRSFTPTECGEGSEPSTTENPDQSTPKDPIPCPDDAELQLYPDP